MGRGEELIATPAAREETVAALQEHFARNHLEVADFERRVEMVERAGTKKELDRALAGLPALEVALAPAAPGRVGTTVRAVLGSTSRRGDWRAPPRVRVVAVLGNAEIDLSTAVLSAGPTEVHVRAVLGNVRVIVPEGLAVECSGDAVLGSFDHLAQASSSRRDRRSVRIVGVAVFGSVEIVVKKRQGLLSGIKALLTG